MRHALIVISTVLVLVSPLVYIHSIVKGSTRPHRTTRFVLMVITLLSALSLVSAYKEAAFWLAAASAVQGLVVFLLSIKKGMGGWARLDVACLLIALIGIILWQMSGEAIVGLYASIIADLVGCIPTFAKAYKLPDTEDWRFFAIDTVASVLSIAALITYSAYSLGYPAYILLVNGGLVAVILIRKRTLAT
jgi:hypothetical protein